MKCSRLLKHWSSSGLVILRMRSRQCIQILLEILPEILLVNLPVILLEILLGILLGMMISLPAIRLLTLG